MRNPHSFRRLAKRIEPVDTPETRQRKILTIQAEPLSRRSLVSGDSQDSGRRRVKDLTQQMLQEAAEKAVAASLPEGAVSNTVCYPDPDADCTAWRVDSLVWLTGDPEDKPRRVSVQVTALDINARQFSRMISVAVKMLWQHSIAAPEGGETNE